MSPLLIFLALTVRHRGRRRLSSSSRSPASSSLLRRTSWPGLTDLRLTTGWSWSRIGHLELVGSDQTQRPVYLSAITVRFVMASAQFSFGRRGCRRCKTASCWRRIKISAVLHVSSRRDSGSHAASRVIRRVDPHPQQRPAPDHQQQPRPGQERRRMARHETDGRDAAAAARDPAAARRAYCSW